MQKPVLKIKKFKAEEKPTLTLRVSPKTHNYVNELVIKSGRGHHEVLAEMVEFAYKHAVVVESKDETEV